MKHSKATIAIVDDDRCMCSLLVKLFQKRGLPVSFADRYGEEAMLKLEKADPKPDIVIMDYVLPEAYHLDMAREIRMRRPSTRIIFLSFEADAAGEAYAAGAVLFLVKQVSIKTITDAIDVVHNNQGKYEYDGFKFVKSEF
jgi:DNA-binding NarL/FixJ family response regulator